MVKQNKSKVEEINSEIKSYVKSGYKLRGLLCHCNLDFKSYLILGLSVNPIFILYSLDLHWLAEIPIGIGLWICWYFFIEWYINKLILYQTKINLVWGKK